MNTIQNIIKKATVTVKYLKDDGKFPNNPKLPLLIYKDALDLSSGDAAAEAEEIIFQNSWGNSWRNGVYEFHHYHSTAHEVLVVYNGQADLMLGGENGIKATVKKGDVIIIPAGVAHKNIYSANNFKIIGAYPAGQNWDMNFGKPGERPESDEKIANVPQPSADPVYGSEGPLMENWFNNG